MKRVILLALAAALLLCGCAMSASSDVSGFAPASEERLTVFTCLEESLYAPLVKEFQERTGIWVSLETGSAPELLARAAGEPGCCDLLLGCGVDALLASGVSTEVWEALSMQVPVIVYNPKLIRQNPPAAIADLLTPDWHGKIAFADPASSGFSRSLLCAMVYLFPEETPEALLAALQSNLTGLLTDPQEVVNRVSDGTYCLALVPEETALTAIGEGASLTLVYPEEGLFLIPDCAAIPEDAAHGENARAFLDFCLSADTQRHAQDYHGRRSVLPELTAASDAAVPYDAAGAGALLPELLDIWDRLWEGTP